MKYREVYGDGCNGFRLGEAIEATPNEDGEIILPKEGDDEDNTVYSSRNEDGLFENENGDLLVPVG